MFRYKRAFVGLLAVWPLFSGCGQFGDWVAPGVVVTLVNNGDYDVDATLAISSDPNISEADLIASGTEIDVTIPPGESRVIRRDCLELRAIMVENAELQVIGGFGPTAQSEVIREGQGSPRVLCQGFLTFTFDHNDSILDFDVIAE